MNMGLAAGATIVTMPRFDLEQFLALHQEHGLTRAFVAPPMVVALAKHPLVDEYDLSALRWCSPVRRRCRPSWPSSAAPGSAARWCRATA